MASPIVRARRGVLAALAAAALASACAPKGEFPSLARRAIEAEDPLEEVVRTRPVVADDAAVRSRAAELLDIARRGDRAFGAAYGPAASAARAAGAPGSESWVVAEQALTRAEAARAQTTLALADLDRLATERAGVPTSEADFEILRAALAEAGAIVRSQQQRFDALRAIVRR